MNFRNFLNLYEKMIEGEIKKIEDKKNPIIVTINDKTINGTEVLLSPSEYRRYKNTNKLNIGAKVRIYLQKHPEDKRNVPFQISRVKFL